MRFNTVKEAYNIVALRMDWIENVERIENEDRGLLLDEFEESGELAERIDTFLDQTRANKNDVDKILDSMLNCMNRLSSRLKIHGPLM
jgi:hypothetical protein